MTATASKSAALPADASLINPEFIQRLQEQRVLHKREVEFHLAEAEKYGAADEALASMIQAAEKIVAIMFPSATKAAEAPVAATTADSSAGPSWTEPTLAVVGKAPEPLTRSEPLNHNEPQTHDEPPAASGAEDPSSDDRARNSGNVWRTRLLGTGT